MQILLPMLGKWPIFLPQASSITVRTEYAVRWYLVMNVLGGYAFMNDMINASFASKDDLPTAAVRHLHSRTLMVCWVYPYYRVMLINDDIRIYDLPDSFRAH